MALESGNYISALVSSNPTGADPKSLGDDHLRLIKSVLRNSFPGYNGTVISTGTDSGAVNTYVLNPAQALIAYTLNMVVEFVAATANTGASTLNISGLGATPIRTVDNVALGLNDIQAGQVVHVMFDGTVFRLLAVTKRYVDQLAFSATLPLQTGNTGKILTTDGTNASWTADFGVAMNEKKGADVASAGTIDLTAATGNFVHVTGTTTITAITIPSGAERVIVFDGILTLTHNATTLILPTAANITTAAGDVAVVRGDGSGNARVVLYERASGIPLVLPAFALLAILTPTAAANVDALNAFTSRYDNIQIRGQNIKPNADDSLSFRYANAGVVDASANYRKAAIGNYGAAATSVGMGSNVLTGTAAASNFIIDIRNVNGTTSIKSAKYEADSQTAAAPTYTRAEEAVLYTGTSAISGIRFFWTGGTTFLAQGLIRIYGYNNT